MELSFYTDRMKSKRQLKISLVGLVAAVVAVLAGVVAQFIYIGHPSDSEMIASFHRDKESLEKIASMFCDENPVVEYIEPSGKAFAGSWTCQGSPERIRKFRQLFQECDLKEGVRRVDDDFIAIPLSFRMHSEHSGSTKGYAFLFDDPVERKPVFSTLDWFYPDQKRVNYRHIEGPWYLYLEFATYQQIGPSEVNEEEIARAGEYNSKRLGVKPKPQKVRSR